jgi:uncharacterized OsmC-like protein
MMNNAQTSQQQSVILNGLNVEQLFQTIDAVKGDPALAQFEFRAKNQWINGGENRSTIKDFYGVGAEDESRDKPFVLTNGEPPVFLGNNEGANPVEFLLHALAGCLTTTIVLHAVARDIRIHELSTELEGTIDVQGVLAVDDTVPVGYKQIKIKLHIKADCSDDELDELLSFAKDHSPVCNTICRPVPVTVERVT